MTARVRLLAVLLAALAVVAGLIAVAPAVTTTWVRRTVTLTVDGEVRSYLVVRPAGATGPLPVLMELHGALATPEVEAARSGFVSVARPAILIYPAGYGMSWNDGVCCHEAARQHIDDVAFLTAVTRQVRATEPGADPAATYLVGFSNGAKMAYRMACDEPGLFTAYAVYGAVASVPCARAAPVSLLLLWTAADPESPADQVAAQLALYRAADRCTSGPEAGGTAEATTTIWTGCRGGALVQSVRYNVGGHAWPASAPAEIWGFFRRAGGIASGPTTVAGTVPG
jgi:polyhydroxybutyrate depolymerase